MVVTIFTNREICVIHNTIIVKRLKEQHETKQIKRPENQYPSCGIHFSNVASHLRLSKLCKSRQQVRIMSVVSNKNLKGQIIDNKSYNNSIPTENMLTNIPSPEI